VIKAIEKNISLEQLIKKFPDEESGRFYFEKLFWNNIPQCPFCHKTEQQYKQTRDGKAGYYRCNKCVRVYTVKAGTIMERSHVPYHKWLITAYFMAMNRKGISSTQLANALDITQRTALFLLHRLREAGADINPALLRGEIEADETYIGGKEHNKHASKKLKLGRGAVGKIPVLGLRERGGRTFATILPDTSAKTIQDILGKRIDKNATLYTDESSSYKGNKFNHKVVNHSAKQLVDGKAHTNSVESLRALKKRTILGTHHKVSPKHLPRYVAELVYRQNEGNTKYPTMDRINALMNKSKGKSLTTRI